MRSRIGAIARKEVLHILRDWRTMGMSFALPLIMVLLFGYAITFDIRNIRMAVYDGDRTAESRQLIDKFTSSGYFKLVGTSESDGRLGEFLQTGQAQIAISIPDDFGKSLARNEPMPIAVLVDGSESNTANYAVGYVQAILTDLSVDFAFTSLASQGLTQPPPVPPVEVAPRFWYNSELRSQNYIIPGLIATIMMVMTALLTSLCIVGEKERGTLEQLLSTPVRVHEILIGKLIPYFAIGFIDSVMVAVVGVFVMGVPFVGSIGLFVLGTVVFALAGLGIGLRISTVSHNQVMAMQLAILISMLPSFLLSGFMFAIKNMPDWVQMITYVIPARYFLVILRGIFLKDNSLALLWPQMAFLAVLATVLLAITIKTFNKKIE